MSVSFMWELIKPEKAKAFRNGTSSDVETLRRIFGKQVSSTQIPVLNAMHAATRQKESLWGDIAATLERLQGEDYEKEVKLRIWTEY